MKTFSGHETILRPRIALEVKNTNMMFGETVVKDSRLVGGQRCHEKHTVIADVTFEL